MQGTAHSLYPAALLDFRRNWVYNYINTVEVSAAWNDERVTIEFMSQKIAIVTDSNSGISQAQAKELGIYVIPMPFLINEESYFEDINLTQEEFYEKLKEDIPVSTSQPAIGDVLDLWDEILRSYDAILHIPMSSGLSNSCATAKVMATEYNGRVQVVDNQRISVIQRQSVMDAVALVNAGKSAREVREILEKEKLEASVYVMMDTLKYLKRGGRITPAAAAVATVLRIRPILQIQGGKLDAFDKARGEKAGKRIMLDAMEKDIETRFGGMDKVRIFVAHTNDPQGAAEFAQAVFQAYGTEVTYCDPLSLSVSCHIGPGALAIACSKKIPEDL